jgi:tRNA modification GTPase
VTHVAVLTPPGTGAIATIALTGPRAWKIVREKFSRELPDVPEVGRTWFGTLGDEVIVAATANGVEVHCHGGPRVVRWLVERFVAAGCEEVSSLLPSHWEGGGLGWGSLRAGRYPPPQPSPPRGEGARKSEIDVRALEPLTRAPTLRTANILLDQLHGAFAREVAALGVASRLTALKRFAPLGRHLVSAWKVVIAGPPNVGKSSLVNALAGFQRSIVAPVAGTTRDAVTVPVAFDGWPVELTDTAGIRHAADALEAEGVERARRVLADADLVVWVLDGTAQSPEWPDFNAGLFVVNKSDQPLGWEPAADVLRVSAATGDGVADLGRRIAAILVPVAPSPGDAVPFTPDLADAVDRAAAAVEAGTPDLADRILADIRR